MKKLFSIIILVVLIAIGVGIYFATPTRPDPNSLVIAPASYDFGNIDGKTIMQKDFIITNWRTDELTLKGAVGSQDDLTVYFIDQNKQKISDIKIGNRQSATLRVEFDPTKYSSLTGEIERTASFKTSSWKLMSIKIPIKATIKR